MFLSGPRVVQAVAHAKITSDELGGAEVRSTRSGLVHLVADDTAGALDLARAVLSYLPNSCWELPPMGGRGRAGTDAAVTGQFAVGLRRSHCGLRHR